MKKCKECGKKAAPGRSRCYSCYGAYRRGGPKPNYIAPSPMRILFLDIETKPDTVYTWSYFKANIGLEQVIETGDVICFAAKWFGDDEIMFFDAREDLLTMVEAAYKLLDEADVVIHFYGSEFDIPWLNREFLENGWLPPSPFKQIDLKKQISKNFKFTSNKLQAITKQLSLEGKLEHEGFRLWVGCIEDDDEAWAKMEAYNRQDVNLLEELYEIVLPWIANHPHRWLYDENSSGCPYCGHGDLVEAGYAYTNVSQYPQFRCTSCGTFFRSNKRNKGVNIQPVYR